MKKYFLLFIVLMFTGCTLLDHKALAVTGVVEAFKIESLGSFASGTFLPNVIFGGAVASYASSPIVEKGDKTSAPVFTMVRRNSLFGSIFGIEDYTLSMTYIGVAGETAEESDKRISAFANAFDGKRSLFFIVPDEKGRFSDKKGNKFSLYVSTNGNYPKEAEKSCLAITDYEAAKNMNIVDNKD